MTNKSFFYKQNSHVSNEKKHECRCEDVMDRMNEEIENLKTIIKGYKDELKKVERDRTV
jgi:hypothetical protein